MSDHSTISSVPDYELDDRLELEPAQLKLMLEPTRLRIIDLLSERAATTSQLADVLGRPKGTIGHHCKALERAGLIRVVRTARVRAMEERYYGRTARLFIMGSFEKAGVQAESFLDEPLAELKRSMRASPDESSPHFASVRYARIDDDRAHEFSNRLGELFDEFAAQPRQGATTYGLMAAFFATERKGFE